jgi:hypothetical protein
MSIESQLYGRYSAAADKAQTLDQLKAIQNDIYKATQSGILRPVEGVPLVQGLTPRIQKAEQAQQQALMMQYAPQAQGMMPQGIAQGQPAPAPIAPQIMAQAQQLSGVDNLRSNLPAEEGYAAGGIIAFAGGGLGDTEDDTEDGIEDYGGLSKQEQAIFDQFLADIGGSEEDYQPQETTADYGINPERQGTFNQGISYREPVPSGGERGITANVDRDQARKYNVGNLRPSGFTYPGQVGISGGGFAMFENPEAGIAALNQDIGIKLRRGLDTPLKFISVYAPAADRNDVGAYAGNVARALGIGPNDRIPDTPESRSILASAITRQEGAHKATARFNNGGVVAFGDPILNPNETQLVSDGDKGIDAIGAELDALRSGTTTLEKAATAGGSRIPASQEVIDAYNYAKAQRDAKEKEYYNLLSKAGVDKPAFMPQYSMQPKRPVPNPTVAAMSAQPINNLAPAPTVVPTIPAAAPASAPAVLQDKYDPINASQEGFPLGGYPAAAAPATAAPAGTSEDLLELRAALKERAIDAKKQKETDKYMALLQASLGMMAGTSPYAFANIGQGGSAGIASYAASRKAQTADENAILAGRLGLSKAELLEKARQEALAQRTATTAMNEKRYKEQNELGYKKLEQSAAATAEANKIKRINSYQKAETSWDNSTQKAALEADLKKRKSDWKNDTKLNSEYQAARNKYLSRLMLEDQANALDANAILSNNPQ